MKPRISVLTKDRYLAQKIKLELSDSAEVSLFETEKEISEALSNATDSLLLVDVRAVSLPPKKSCLLIPNGTQLPSDQTAVVFPFPVGQLRDLLFAEKEIARIQVFPESDTVAIDGRTVRLSENEFALFSILWTSNAPIARETLSRLVWGKNANNNLLNVYVHYLRSKLEMDGDRIILLSRKEGYSIAPKYRKGERIC